MNRKFEDNLLRLAFEDISPEEAALLEQDARQDPDAAKALAEYRALRVGLKDLADVPADQLSKERLRDAILARGLKHTPAPSRTFGWAWMPVMAAGLAFVVFAYRPHKMPESNVVAARGPNLFDVPKVEDSSMALALNESKKPMESLTSKATSGTLKVAPTAMVAVRTQYHSISSRHGTRRHVIDQEVFWPDDSSIYGPGGEVSDSGDNRTALASAPTPVTPPAVAESTPPAPPIVLIDGEKDGNTGASKATEVDSSKNVEVRG